LETPGGTDDASVVVDSDARNADIACDSTCSDDLPRLHRSSSRQKQEQHRKRVKIVESDGSTDVLEYSELDVMALLTPEELEEYLAEQCSSRDGGGGQAIQTMNAATQRNPRSNSRSSSGTKNDTDDDQGYSDDEEMTPVVEITSVLEDEESEEIEALNPNRAANLQRIAARSRPASSTVAEAPSRASFAPAQRPSVVAWLKEEVGGSGNTTIRGGTYWTAVAGATRVDDSGLVVLAPRHKVDGIRITSAEYLAVLGTGGFMAKAAPRESDKPEDVQVEVVSRLRKGRSDDPIDVVRVQSTNPSTSCSSIIEVCQDAFQQGVRGDAEANPFDRRGPRRLVHCGKISLSSKAAGSRSFDASSVPFDAAVFLDRGRDRNKLFTSGSFLGRMSFKNSSTTNAFREINAAADGFPGWTVDRYDHWLFVQHNSGTTPLGPLPSIHDGNTAGVYLLEQSNPDRSADGSIRPRLLEGRVAPDRIPILENGITYHVSFQDMSTGIFLDQRPQRAWLARNCGPNTRVLNCFAHSGAYSVAAATAGASTVSVDLSRKWLERLPDQLRANEIDFDERHDAIYGDCFDWLARLAKRGEKYDIVILDPPSSSVGGRKKRRWSVKNDMDELVSLAAGLVKKGGLLWTTTNNAGIHPIKFARVCKKGLEDAGLYDAKLERLQPMPGDFPSIGPQSVKNLVWRIP
jgi:23S rRNA (cytosine1962-C5)-methyltransferase